jgi:multicomponent Na+:H+ antiporter subunit D
MNGVVLTGDLFNLYVFLEIATIASYALVAFGCESEELEASFKYAILGSVASVMILFAIIMLYGLTGTLNLAHMAQLFAHSTPLHKQGLTFCLALFIMGFGVKAALVPFHAWLPDAHPSAPAPISAMLSGVLIKSIGFYALIRIIFNVFGFTPHLSFILTTLGAISMIVGVYLAIGQWDFKRLLAYHSISQMGYVFLGIGLGTPLGILGGLFHLINHATFKSLLFLNSGAIEYSTGTRQLKEMGGLSKVMPQTAVSATAASLSIAGIPPFNGFWSKLFIILAAIAGGHYVLATLAVIVSIITLASFLKVQKFAFFGPLPLSLQEVKEAPFSMVLPMLILALTCLAAGLFFPVVISTFLTPAVTVLLEGTKYGTSVLGGTN